MYVFELPSDTIYQYILTGKFQAPSPDWIHQESPLNDYELIVMTEGTLYLSYQKESFVVETGDFLLLPPGGIRKGTKTSGCSFYWLHFVTGQIPSAKEVPDALLPAYIGASSRKIPIPRHGTIPNQEKVVILMKQLQDEVKNDYPICGLNAMTTTILMELYGQYYIRTQRVSSIKDVQKQLYYDIVDYVKLNISKNLKVAEIAAHFGYNQKYLSHLFATITGTPLKQFILSTKIDAANFMLTDTNKSISQISQELGFLDNHNFTRTYKSVTGLSPSEYRNSFAKRMLFDK